MLSFFGKLDSIQPMDAASDCVINSTSSFVDKNDRGKVLLVHTAANSSAHTTLDDKGPSFAFRKAGTEAANWLNTATAAILFAAWHAFM
jgi:hypothetical protein